MEYYSIIKNNEIMLFAVVWMDLDITTLSEISHTERQTSYDINYMWSLKSGLIYKTEIDSQT